ncbi:MAG: response regulator [Magnetococcales bacterium]|nr:response regulator [Magnetococcales bacterium]
MKVLIADDNFNNRKLLRDILRPYADCDMVNDGKAALELFEADLEDGEPYDLVLMDIVMPVMDGQKAVQRMRAIESELAPDQKPCMIIMVTGMDSSIQAMQSFFKGGAADYLTKPITRQMLLDKLLEHGLVEEDEG